MTEALFLLILLLGLLNPTNSPLPSIQYSADPLFKIEDLFRKPAIFRDIFLFEA